jgi:hypothetical protein
MRSLPSAQPAKGLYPACPETLHGPCSTPAASRPARSRPRARSPGRARRRPDTPSPPHAARNGSSPALVSDVRQRPRPAGASARRAERPTRVLGTIRPDPGSSWSPRSRPSAAWPSPAVGVGGEEEVATCPSRWPADRTMTCFFRSSGLPSWGIWRAPDRFDCKYKGPSWAWERAVSRRNPGPRRVTGSCTRSGWSRYSTRPTRRRTAEPPSAGGRVADPRQRQWLHTLRMVASADWIPH